MGIDVSPGNWAATVPEGSGSCGWRRLASFVGQWDTDLIADGYALEGEVTTEILETDAGFDSFGCGEWTFVRE